MLKLYVSWRGKKDAEGMLLGWRTRWWRSKLLKSMRFKKKSCTVDRWSKNILQYITWMDSDCLKWWKCILCWRNVDKLIRDNMYCTRKNNGKIWNKIKAQCEIYQSDCLSLLQIVIFLFQQHIMKEKSYLMIQEGERGQFHNAFI